MAAICVEVRTNRIYFKMGTTHGPYLPSLIHIVVVVSYKTKMEKVNDRRRTQTAGKVHTGFQSSELIKGYD